MSDFMKINVETNYIESNKIDRNYTICLIADIHNTKYSKIKEWNLLIKCIKSINPTYIIIAGDMIITADDLFNPKCERKLNYLLLQLSNIAPLFITYGNHELKKGKNYNANDVDNYFSKYQNNKRIHIINNNCLKINDINILGVSPIYQSYYPEHKENWEIFLIDALSFLINQISDELKDNFNIMTIHSPEIIYKFESYLNKTINNTDNNELRSKLLKIKENLQVIDLFVSGHMHDGLIPKHWQKISPFKNYRGLVASEGNENTHPSLRVSDICRGTHNIFNGKMIITGGVTKWSNPNILFRIINHLFVSDISVIKIIKKNS